MQTAVQLTDITCAATCCGLMAWGCPPTALSVAWPWGSWLPLINIIQGYSGRIGSPPNKIVLEHSGGSDPLKTYRIPFGSPADPHPDPQAQTPVAGLRIPIQDPLDCPRGSSRSLSGARCCATSLRVADETVPPARFGQFLKSYQVIELSVTDSQVMLVRFS